MAPVVHLVPDLLATSHNMLQVLWVSKEFLDAIGDCDSRNDSKHKHAHIKHVFTLIARKKRPEGVKDIVRVDKVVREDPEVDSYMENGEPNNGAQDCSSNKENEGVPRDIPHALLKPIGPHSEEQEEHDDADHKYKLERCAGALTLGLDLEDVEADRCS